MSSNHLVNPSAIAMAIAAVATSQKTAAAAAPRQKVAFIPQGDPAMDPSAPQGGEGGGDPSMGGGGAPAGGGGADPAAIAQQVMSMIQAQGGGMGGGMGGPGMEPIKPKIDVNVEMLQIKKMLAKICDAMGIQIPASDMAVTSTDLTNMALQGQQGQNGGVGGGGGGSAISPVQPIQGASPGLAGAGGGQAAGGMAGGGMAAGKTAAELAINNGVAFEPAAGSHRSFDTAALGTVVDKAAAAINFRNAASRRRTA
jgi:hypothetical protein